MRAGSSSSWALEFWDSMPWGKGTKIHSNIIAHVLVWFITDVITHWSKSTWRWKFYLGYDFMSQSITEGSQGRKSRQECTGRNWSRIHKQRLFTGITPVVCLAIYFIQLGHNCLGMARTMVGYALAHEYANRKVHHRHIRSPVWWKKYLSWGFLFPGDSSSCQVNKD